METNKNLEILCQNANETFLNAIKATVASVFVWLCLVIVLLFFGNDYSWGEPISLIKKIAIVVTFILCFLAAFSFWKTARKHKKIYDAEKGAL